MLSTCSEAHIRIPSQFSNPSIDQMMLKHYVKAKIMQRKKVCLKEPIQLTIFGRDVTLFIHKLQRL